MLFSFNETNQSKNSLILLDLNFFTFEIVIEQSIFKNIQFSILDKIQTIVVINIILKFDQKIINFISGKVWGAGTLRFW